MKLHKYIKHLLVILFLFVNLLGYGQSIDNLENNNGFKIFKLNSPLSSWSNNLRFIENKGGFSTYEYIRSYSADKTVFSLFDYKVKSVNLTFENSTKKLKKISLDFGETLSVQYLKVLGLRLQKLYFSFEEIIGPTTDYSKPTADCYTFKSSSCIYFEDRIFDGTIIWESNSVILQIYHNAEMKINNDGSSNLKVNKSVSFEDKSYYKSNKMSGF